MHVFAIIDQPLGWCFEAARIEQWLEVPFNEE